MFHQVFGVDSDIVLNFKNITPKRSNSFNFTADDHH
jgi:hypothetical protein